MQLYYSKTVDLLPAFGVENDSSGGSSLIFQETLSKMNI